MSKIDSLIKNFGSLLDDIPGAIEIYTAARQEYLNSNNSGYAKKLYLLNLLLHNSSIPPRCSIGANTILAYGGIGVVIHEGATIGARCNIGANVIVGGTASGVPKIGDDCYLSAGCKVLGSVTVGNCCIIGAGAIVLSNIPDYSVVVGIPARVINTVTRTNFQKYQGCFWCKNKPDSILAFLNYHFPR